MGRKPLLPPLVIFVDDFFNDCLLIDARVITVDELRARSCPPAGRETDVVALVGEYRVWKKRSDLKSDEPYVAFFGGDCSKVLLPDDSRLKA